jgi:hypothetical protein
MAGRPRGQSRGFRRGPPIQDVVGRRRERERKSGSRSVAVRLGPLFDIENLDVPDTLNIESSAFGRTTRTQSVDQA